MNNDEEKVNDGEFENVPDLANVEYQVAIEAVVKMFHDLREAGLPKDDAAAVVAAILLRTA